MDQYSIVSWVSSQVYSQHCVHWLQVNEPFVPFLCGGIGLNQLSETSRVVVNFMKCWTDKDARLSRGLQHAILTCQYGFISTLL